MSNAANSPNPPSVSAASHPGAGKPSPSSAGSSSVARSFVDPTPTMAQRVEAGAAKAKVFGDALAALVSRKALPFYGVGVMVYGLALGTEAMRVSMCQPSQGCIPSQLRFVPKPFKNDGANIMRLLPSGAHLTQLGSTLGLADKPAKPTSYWVFGDGLTLGSLFLCGAVSAIQSIALRRSSWDDLIVRFNASSTKRIPAAPPANSIDIAAKHHKALRSYGKSDSRVRQAVVALSYLVEFGTASSGLGRLSYASVLWVLITVFAFEAGHRLTQMSDD